MRVVLLVALTACAVLGLAGTGGAAQGRAVASARAPELLLGHAGPLSASASTPGPGLQLPWLAGSRLPRQARELGPRIVRSRHRRKHVIPKVPPGVHVRVAKMRRGVDTLRAVATQSVSGSPDTGESLTLRPGASVPTVGRVVVEAPSTVAPNGVLGVVTGSRAGPNGTTVVHLGRASLSDVFSNLNVTASGTLGDANASTASVHAHSASLGPFDPQFSCTGSLPSPMINVDLSSIRYIFDLNFPNSIDLFIGGTPSFSVNFVAPAQVTCTASLIARVPLGETGLFLDIGPQFSLSTGGQVSAGFTWDPKITVAFFRSDTGSGNFDIHTFTNQGGVSFGGSAGVSVGLALSVGVDVFGAAGVDGSIGPSLSATVDHNSPSGETCRSIDGSAAADLNAHADVFGFHWSFNLFHLTFWTHHFGDPCTTTTGTGTGTGTGGSGAGTGGSGTGTGGGGGGGGGGTGTGSTGTSGQVMSLTSGQDQSCATLASGAIDCWGGNDSGELGDGTTTGPSTCNYLYGTEYCSASPIGVSGISTATQASAGANHTCATLASGHIACWGDNGYGELGDGATTGPDMCPLAETGSNGAYCSASPVMVTGILDASQVAAGGGSYSLNQTCALLDTGSIACWGSNIVGQLGDGVSTGPDTCADGGHYCSASPVTVSGITDATQISAGGNDTCARLATGEIDCWGDNSNAELGDGINAGPEICAVAGEYCSTTPVAVSGIANATEVSVGYLQACAVLATGNVDCWGRVDAGGLGDGTTTYSDVPVTVSGISNAAAVSAGDGYTCALLATGHIDCWGGNDQGQLGDGTTTSSAVPVAVSGITNATEIAASGAFSNGGGSTCARLATGQIECWGLGPTGTSDVPVAVSGLS
jgi:alpha-tubulin suppressor-like RCC1 family protein